MLNIDALKEQMGSYQSSCIDVLTEALTNMRDKGIAMGLPSPVVLATMQFTLNKFTQTVNEATPETTEIKNIIDKFETGGVYNKTK